MSQVLDLTHDQYHAGVDERPRLSASIATVLWQKTPLHAWTAHPRLNPHYVREDDGKFDLGTVAHSVLLQGEDIVYVVHEDSWRTKTSKESRDYAREIGKVPLLARDRDRVYEMCVALRAKLPRAIFADGKPEVSLAWTRDDVDFKARIDWLSDDHTWIVDLKTSGQVDRFDRTLYDHGYDIQAAMYRRAVATIFGTTPEYLWVVVETSAPFEFRLVRPGADVLAVAERKLEWAVAKWRECMAAGVWPGYSREIAEAELPPWEEAKLLEKEERS